MNLEEYDNMTPEYANFVSRVLCGIFITSLLWFIYMNCVEMYKLSREIRILRQNLEENDCHDSLLETNREKHSDV